MSLNDGIGRPSRPAGKGFTLIEVLVAMTILAVGILGVMAAFSLCMRAASSSFRLDGAVALAQKEVTSAMALPPENLEPKTGAAGQYAWTLTYTPKPHGLMMVTVVVTWSEQGEPKTYRLAQIFLLRQQG